MELRSALLLELALVVSLQTRHQMLARLAKGPGALVTPCC
jgi:hypothetical protein